MKASQYRWQSEAVARSTNGVTISISCRMTSLHNICLLTWCWKYLQECDAKDEIHLVCDWIRRSCAAGVESVIEVASGVKGLTRLLPEIPFKICSHSISVCIRLMNVVRLKWRAGHGNAVNEILRQLHVSLTMSLCVCKTEHHYDSVQFRAFTCVSSPRAINILLIQFFLIHWKSPTKNCWLFCHYWLDFQRR